MSESKEPEGSTLREAFPPATSFQFSEQLRPAIVGVLTLTVLTGCVFPLLLFAIGRPLFPRQANGSLLIRDGVIVGSEQIGQQFTQPEYFQPRPSAAGKGYDATASSGTNLGPNNSKLKDGAAGFPGIRQLAEEYRRSNGLSPDTPIPADAVTRSASGLDPDISPENAALQARRVAQARGVSRAVVLRLVADYIKGPQFGVLGSPRVSVLELNLALDQSLKRPLETKAR
ncbi:MAG TPA: potassium-transporting ATPase subunit KdpC [Bryobacteraceae bacterium]|nr:potassium-transporting ATPase subunit KdpC [Bryobacteraceae bacterium]